MKRIIIALLLLSPATIFSQNFIGKNKKQVKKFLQQQITKNDSLTITLTDNDSVILYSIKAGKVLPADFVYGFTNAGKCRLEKVTAECDSCYQKFLRTVLEQKKYGWKKINENQYISKYAARLMIELPAESKELSYTILRTKWSKQLYNQLKGD
jgi:hypothetical protein